MYVGTNNLKMCRKTVSLDNPLVQTYMVHSALLVGQLLALSPLAALSWVSKGCSPDPIIIQNAYLSELKNLAPFWIAGALFVTTKPDVEIGKILFRMFTAARMIQILGYATRPLPSPFTDLALLLSYTITCYMSMYVVSHYRNAI